MGCTLANLLESEELSARKGGRIVTAAPLAYHKSMAIFSKLLGYLILLGFSAALLAAGPEADTVRENCRKSVSGAYLSVYDRMVRARDYKIFLERELTRHKSALTKSQQTLKTKEKAMKDNEFDTVLAADYDAAKAGFDTLTEKIAEVELLIKQAQEEHDAQKLVVEKMEKKIRKVFNIEKVQKVLIDSGYPIQVVYRGDCSKYRYTCPLSRQEAFDLVKIFDNQPQGEDCKKYASHSGIDF